VELQMQFHLSSAIDRIHVHSFIFLPLLSFFPCFSPLYATWKIVYPRLQNSESSANANLELQA
jgi:hypothetical protein